jgi:hypothetical protein
VQRNACRFGQRGELTTVAPQLIDERLRIMFRTKKIILIDGRSAGRAHGWPPLRDASIAAATSESLTSFLRFKSV